jgi:hypothetical protein
MLFVGCAVGKVTIEQMMRKIWPFYAVMFLVLMFVTTFRRFRSGCHAISCDELRGLIPVTDRCQGWSGEIHEALHWIVRRPIG